MTITSSGFCGMNFDDMVSSSLPALLWERDADAAAVVVKRVAPAMRVRRGGGLRWWSVGLDDVLMVLALALVLAPSWGEWRDGI